jgi:glycosidase
MILKPALWAALEKWNLDLQAGFKELISIRKSHDALINGGIRWIHTSEDSMAYLRESKKESLLIYISRTGVKEKIDLTEYGYKIEETRYGKSATGKVLSINSKTATSGIWKLA